MTGTVPNLFTAEEHFLILTDNMDFNNVAILPYLSLVVHLSEKNRLIIATILYANQ